MAMSTRRTPGGRHRWDRVNSGVKVDRINGGEVDTLYVAG